MGTLPAQRRTTALDWAIFVVVVLLVGAIVYFVYRGVSSLTAGLLRLDNEVAAAVIATSGTVLAAVATVVYSQSRTKRREIDESHRARKAEVYGEFMKLMVGNFKSVKAQESLPEAAGGAPANAESTEQLFSFKQNLIVWGHPKVIRSYTRFESQLQDADPKTMIVSADRVLRAMRRDLGNSNLFLKQGELWGLFLTVEARQELGI